MIDVDQRLALLGVLAAIGGAAEAEAKRPVIRVEFPHTADHRCAILIQGVRHTPGELLAVAKMIRKKEPGAHIRLGGTQETPWECFGGALTAFQRAGFADIGFVGEPAP